MDEQRKLEYVLRALEMYSESEMKKHLDKAYGVDSIKKDIQQYDEITDFVLEKLK